MCIDSRLTITAIKIFRPSLIVQTHSNLDLSEFIPYLKVTFEMIFQDVRTFYCCFSIPESTRVETLISINAAVHAMELDMYITDNILFAEASKLVTTDGQTTSLISSNTLHIELRLKSVAESSLIYLSYLILSYYVYLKKLISELVGA